MSTMMAEFLEHADQSSLVRPRKDIPADAATWQRNVDVQLPSLFYEHSKPYTYIAPSQHSSRAAERVCIPLAALPDPAASFFASVLAVLAVLQGECHTRFLLVRAPSLLPHVARALLAQKPDD